MNTLPSKLLALMLFALPTAAAAQRGDPAYTEDRLNQLQQSLTLLTGQIEQLQYKNQQLQQQYPAEQRACGRNRNGSLQQPEQHWSAVAECRPADSERGANHE